MEEKKISVSQMLFLIAGFAFGSTLLLSFVDNMLHQDSWLAIIAAIVVFSPFAWAIAALARRFPGVNFMDVLTTVFGKVLGWVFFLLYAGNFFVLMVFNLRDLADFYIGYIIPDMPKTVLLIVTVLVGAYAVRKGITSIAKIAIVAVVYSILNVLLATVFLVDQIDFSNLLPILNTPPGVFAKGTHIMAAIPYAEVFVFLMVMPQMRDNSKTMKPVFGGLGLAAALFLTITVRNTAVLGPSTLIYAGNTYQAMRMINIGEFFTRVELLSAIGITLALFVKIIMLYYVSVTSVSQLLRLNSSASLILPFGGLAVILALIAFSSTIEHAYYAARNHAFYSLLFAFILPPLALLIAALRKLPRKDTGKR